MEGGCPPSTSFTPFSLASSATIWMEPLRSMSREGRGGEEEGREADNRAARARPAKRGVSRYLTEGGREGGREGEKTTKVSS